MKNSLFALKFALVELFLFVHCTIGSRYNDLPYNRSSQQVLAYDEVLDTCTDGDFKLLINKSTMRFVPCSWIDDGQTLKEVQFRRNAQCFKQKVKASCQRACGACCGDNEFHIFNVLDESSNEIGVSCSWLAENESRQKKYCPKKKLTCPSACGLCSTSFGLSGGPSHSPSSSISNNPSGAPTDHFSFQPTTSTSSSPSKEAAENPSEIISPGQKQEKEEEDLDDEVKYTFFQHLKFPLIVLSACAVAGIGMFFLHLHHRNRENNEEKAVENAELDITNNGLDQDNFLVPTMCGVWPTNTMECKAGDNIPYNLERTGLSFAMVHSKISKATATVSAKLASMMYPKSSDDTWIDENNTMQS